MESHVKWRAMQLGVLLCVCLCGCSHTNGRQVTAAHRDRAKAEQLRDAALADIDRGAWADAESKLRAALDADPFDGPAHANLGVVLWKQGKLFDAGWALRHACQLMPKAAQPRHNLGLLFESAGRNGLAEEQYRAALLCDPDDVEIVGHLARVRVRQSKFDPETFALVQTIATSDNDEHWRTWAQGFLAIRNDAKD